MRRNQAYLITIVSLIATLTLLSRPETTTDQLNEQGPAAQGKTDRLYRATLLSDFEHPKLEVRPVGSEFFEVELLVPGEVSKNFPVGTWRGAGGATGDVPPSLVWWSELVFHEDGVVERVSVKQSRGETRRETSARGRWRLIKDNNVELTL